MATKRAIGEVLAVLVVSYGDRFSLRDNTPDVYAALLNDVPDGLLVAAAKLHVTRSKWPPTIADLRECAADLQDQAEGIVTAEQAWNQVNKAISEVGSYGNPTFDKLTTMTVEDLGGWRTICLSENPVADRAHFLKVYKELARTRRSEAYMLPELKRTALEMRRNWLVTDGKRETSTQE